MGYLRFAGAAVTMAVSIGGCTLPPSDLASPKVASTFAEPPLVGSTPDRVLQALGPPAMRRVDPPGQYWRYAIDGCSVDLFFFPDEASKAVRVTWYDARPMGAATDRCAALRARFGPLRMAG